MRPHVRVRAIGAAGHLTLRETGDLIELIAGNVVLLSSAALATELSFGRLAADLAGRPPKRVIIGGLGFGATLRGVLEVSPPGANVVVVEKVEAVVDLVRSGITEVSRGVLDDPRVELAQADVGDVIAARAGDVDAILLDVDNGPHWASFRSNARLYTPGGLAAARRALHPGGALAVWSGYRSDPFLGHLRSAGLTPETIPLHERGRVRARAYVGRKRA